MTAHRLSFLWAIFLIGLLGAPNTGAQERDPDSENEEVWIQRGLELRRAHRDAEALVEFERAYASSRSARALAQMALARQALGQWVEAERDLTEALAAADDPWISSRKELLQQSLEAIRDRLAFLVVESNVSPSTLFLNGVPVGELPLPPLRVPAGTVQVEVRTAAHGAAKRALQVKGRTTVVETIHFVTPTATRVAEPVAAPSVVRPKGAAPLARPDSNRSTVAGREAHASARTRDLHRALSFGFLGATGVSLGGAVVAQLIRERHVARYNDDRRCFYGQLSRDQRCGADRGAAETAETYANLGYVGATAFGAAALTLLLTMPDERGNEASRVWAEASPAAVRFAWLLRL